MIIRGIRVRHPGKTFDFDVAVVGAGVAGLAATNSLIGRGASVCCLEAEPRVGGRVWTDSHTFGVPFDRGARWLYDRHRNPFVDYARRNGFHVHNFMNRVALFVGSQIATEGELSDFNRAIGLAEEAMADAGRNGLDAAPADVVPDLGEWRRTVECNVGEFEIGKGFGSFSCVDWWRLAQGTDDGICAEGYGILIENFAKWIPVHLNTTVINIDWAGAGITLSTTRGAIHVRKCIVTCSMGLLAAGRPLFSPALPARFEEAINRLSMGFYNNIGISLREKVFDCESDTYLVSKVVPATKGTNNRAIGFLSTRHSNMLLGFVGGWFAADLERDGQSAVNDFVREEFRRLWGSKAERSIKRIEATNWGRSSVSLGAYSSASPGAAQMREVLRVPLDDKLFFAGEACSETGWGTVHGAYASGLEAADCVWREDESNF